jgi:hypothetical protein
MLRDDLVALVLFRLANRTDVTGKLTPGIQSELQMAQGELEYGNFMPWFLERDVRNAFTTTVQSDAEYPLPTDFLRPQEFMLFWFNPLVDPSTDSPWCNVLKDTDYAVALQRWKGYSSPRKYYMTATGLCIFPMSDKAYQMRLRYYGTEPPLTSNIENGWTKSAPDVLAAQTCLVIASQVLKDAELTMAFAGDLKMALVRLHTAHEARTAADAHWTSGDD